MTAYYNELDKFAAQWLRNLIAEGHIADGIVDTRSIRDVSADDLAGFTQCHFFAGIGVWSHSLRIAGWPDDRHVWTGSCPCQPFSGAGKGEGFEDERHLWPDLHRLIGKRQPRVFFGEQVASKDGLAWLDLVRADMEGSGYAIGAFDLCAAGIGAPHIRQRLWIAAERLADADGGRRAQGWQGTEGLLSDADSTPRGLGDNDDARLEGQRRGSEAQGRRDRAVRPAAEAGEPRGMADADQERREGNLLHPVFGGGKGSGQIGRATGCGATRESGQPGPTNGFWSDPDWLFCRDGKWRPVEPGTFPLAHGAPARVGRLRAYGNAIVPQVAAEVIAAFMECRP